MAEDKPKDERILLKCVCDRELQLEPALLGRVFRCPFCRRYLRPALQFQLMDLELAPNLTAMCPCGRFIVDSPRRAGKVATCKGCGRQVILPQPVDAAGRDQVVRIPRRVLERQLRRVSSDLSVQTGEVDRLQAAGHRGTISLKAGQKLCVNPTCSAPLPAGAQVCPICGTNAATGVAYKGPGPDGDPKGKWRQV